MMVASLATVVGAARAARDGLDQQQRPATHRRRRGAGAAPTSAIRSRATGCSDPAGAHRQHHRSPTHDSRVCPELPAPTQPAGARHRHAAPRPLAGHAQRGAGVATDARRPGSHGARPRARSLAPARSAPTVTRSTNVDNGHTRDLRDRRANAALAHDAGDRRRHAGRSQQLADLVQAPHPRRRHLAVTLTRRQAAELLERHGLAPEPGPRPELRRRPNTVRRIARLAGVGPGDRVVEIGAGLGSLTAALAETGADGHRRRGRPRPVPRAPRARSAARRARRRGRRPAPRLGRRARPATTAGCSSPTSPTTWPRRSWPTSSTTCPPSSACW